MGRAQRNPSAASRRTTPPSQAARKRGGSKKLVTAGDHSMSTKPYDVVRRGGTVATSSAVFPADVAIDGETVAAVGRNLPPGVKEIDARGKLVVPGGVDSHAHIEQVSAAGISDGPLFRPVAKGGRVGALRLTGKGVCDLVKAYAQRLGLKAAGFCAPSPR